MKAGRRTPRSSPRTTTRTSTTTAPGHAHGARPYTRSTALGVLGDIDLFDKLNVVVGGRYDIIEVKNEEFAGTFNTTTGTAANPGAFRTTAASRRRRDKRRLVERRASRTRRLNLRPYVTYARAQRAARRQQQPHRQQRRHRRRDRQGGAQGARHQGELLQRQAVLRARRATSRAASKSAPDDDPSLLTAEVSSTISEG